MKDKYFTNEAVEIDSRRFIRCTFENVSLVYRGKVTFALFNNTLTGLIKMDVKSNPSLVTLVILERELRQFNPTVRFEEQ
jgi:hypothetical protein